MEYISKKDAAYGQFVLVIKCYYYANMGTLMQILTLSDFVMAIS